MKDLLVNMNEWSRDDHAAIWTDNEGCLKIIAQDNYWQSERTKHIRIRWATIRSGIDEGHYTVDYVATDENRADIFTKGLGHGKFEEVRDICNC